MTKYIISFDHIIQQLYMLQIFFELCTLSVTRFSDVTHTTTHIHTHIHTHTHTYLYIYISLTSGSQSFNWSQFNKFYWFLINKCQYIHKVTLEKYEKRSFVYEDYICQFYDNIACNVRLNLQYKPLDFVFVKCNINDSTIGQTLHH